MNLYENYIEAVAKPYSWVSLAIFESSGLALLKFKTLAQALKQLQFYNALLRTFGKNGQDGVVKKF